jgi:PAS domain S-box-containing protein
MIGKWAAAHRVPYVDPGCPTPVPAPRRPTDSGIELRRSYSIRTVLLALALACLTPVTVALVYSAFTDYSGDQARVRLFIHTLARANAAKVSRILSDARATLGAFVQRAAKGAGGTSPCDPKLADDLKVLRTYSALTMVDPDGVEICRFVLPGAAGPGPAAGSDWFRRVSRDKDFSIGRSARDPVTGLSSPVFSLPTRGPGNAISGYMALAISREAFDADAHATTLPAGTRSGLVTTGGEPLWTGPASRGVPEDDTEFVDVIGQMLQVRDGTFDGAHGTPVHLIYAVAPIPGVPLYGFLGIPSDAAHSLDLQDSIKTVAVGVLNLVLAIGAALLLARRIVAPVRGLAESAEALERGDLGVRAPVAGSTEMRHVAAAFNTLVEQWQAAQRRLRASAIELDDLYQNAPCGYHSHDEQGRLLRVNDTELRWLGYARADVDRGLHMHDVLTPDSRRAFDAAMPGFLASGRLRGLELEFVRRDGTVFPGAVDATAVFSPDGRFVMSRSTLFDLTERRAMEREVAERAEHNAILTRHLMSVEEETKRALSAELHDRASGNLAALRTQLTVMRERLRVGDESDEAAMFDDCGAILEDTNRSLREVCASLRPPMLDRAGLSQALESYAEQFARRTGMAVRVDAAALSMRLAPELESSLFRIAQEALTNAAKHSQARHVEIRLSGGDGRFTLSVSDDGIGFDPDARPASPGEGLGLMTMRDRAEFIGARFMLQTAPRAGTLVQVEI